MQWSSKSEARASKVGLRLLEQPPKPSIRDDRTRKFSLAATPASGTHAAPSPGQARKVQLIYVMSQHNSLRAAAGTTGAKRNVLKRFERVALLKSRGQWKEGERVTGLRKTIPPQ